MTITVEAPSAVHAVELAGTVLRTGIHASGGNTSGWDDIRCDLRSAPRRATRRGRRDHGDAAISWAALATVDTDEWALAGQRARHLDRHDTDLPPLVGAVIDLR